MPLTETTSTRPLRGIIVRADADKLIVEATPDQIARFNPTTGQEAEIQRTATAAMPGGFLSGNGSVEDRTLFDRFGRAVAIVTDVSIHQELIDVTNFSSDQQTYLHGHRTVDIRAIGLPSANYDPTEQQYVQGAAMWMTT